jgi:HD-like signal output (HDOD) protein
VDFFVQEIMGVTHAEIGGVLAGEWKFANNYVNTIIYHHKPQDAARYKRLVSLVHIADVITRQLEFGSGGDSTVPEVEEAALDQLSMQARGLEMLVEAVKEELEGADSFLAALSS